MKYNWGIKKNNANLSTNMKDPEGILSEKSQDINEYV